MTTSYEISNYEYGISLEDIKGTTTNMAKVVIPKYMTNMKTGLKQSKEIINKNLFVNASDCKIKVPTTIKTQGYITVSKYPNELLDFSNKVILDEKGNPYIPKDSTFIIEVLYEDVANMHLTGKV